MDAAWNPAKSNQKGFILHKAFAPCRSFSNSDDVCVALSDHTTCRSLHCPQTAPMTLSTALRNVFVVKGLELQTGLHSPFPPFPFILSLQPGHPAGNHYLLLAFGHCRLSHEACFSITRCLRAATYTMITLSVYL